jgi:hypothetical protein
MVEEATEIKGNRVDMTTTAVEMDSEEVVVSAAEVTIVTETLEVTARILDGKIITAAAAIKVVDIKEAAVVDTTVGEVDNHMVEEDHPFTVAEVMEEEAAVEVIMTGAEEEDMDQRRMPWASMVMIARTRSWRWNSSTLMKSRLQASILIRYAYFFYTTPRHHIHSQVHQNS